jgi:BMFP domain-containing protein YqiC
MRDAIEAVEAVTARLAQSEKEPIEALVREAREVLRRQEAAAPRWEAERLRRRAKIERLEARVAELEARYEPRTPDPSDEKSETRVRE